MKKSTIRRKGKKVHDKGGKAGQSSKNESTKR